MIAQDSKISTLTRQVKSALSLGHLSSPVKRILIRNLIIFGALAWVIAIGGIYQNFSNNSGGEKQIEVPIISQTPTASASASPQYSLPSPHLQTAPQIPSQTAQKKPTGNISPLCKDTNDPWTLVPDPAQQGRYIICNVVTETMTTVQELNTAQNNYRKNQSLGTLAIDDDLCKIASRRATEVSTNFSHDGFEKAVDESNVSYSAMGENLASGPLSGVHFVEWSWDKSPGHRANMRGDWAFGCGGVYDRFAVFIFAR